MLPTTIRNPPSVADYMSLADYESHTPASFIDGKTVLHFHLGEAVASVPESQRGSLAIFPSDMNSSPKGEINGETEESIRQTVQVFVTSE